MKSLVRIRDSSGQKPYPPCLLGSSKTSRNEARNSGGRFQSHIPVTELLPTRTATRQKAERSHHTCQAQAGGCSPCVCHQRLCHQRLAATRAFLSSKQNCLALTIRMSENKTQAVSDGRTERQSTLSHSSVYCGNTNVSCVHVSAENTF